jgi:hypothetical protein
MAQRIALVLDSWLFPGGYLASPVIQVRWGLGYIKSAYVDLAGLEDPDGPES